MKPIIFLFCHDKNTNQIYFEFLNDDFGNITVDDIVLKILLLDTKNLIGMWVMQIQSVCLLESREQIKSLNLQDKEKSIYWKTFRHLAGDLKQGNAKRLLQMAVQYISQGGLSRMLLPLFLIKIY